jgi:hypothetical protein
MGVGRVIFASRNLAMLVVQHDQGFTVVEMLGDEGRIVVGDQVHGDWLAVAGEPIRQGEEVYDAFFQGCWGDPKAAVRIAGG